MKHLTFLPILVVFIFTPWMAYAQSISDDTLNALIAHTRIEEQIDQYPAATKQGFYEAAVNHLGPENQIFDAFNAAVEEEMKSAFILEILKQNIKKNIAEEEALEIIKWCQTDLGHSILEAEVKASHASTMQEVVMNTSELLQDGDNVVFAKELNDVVEGTELVLALQEQSMLSTMRAVTLLKDPNAVIDEAQLQKTVTDYVASSIGQIDQMMILTFAYTYQDFTSEEKSRYMEFLQSPVGKKLNNVYSKSLIESLSVSYEKLAFSFADKLKNIEKE